MTLNDLPNYTAVDNILNASVELEHNLNTRCTNELIQLVDDAIEDNVNDRQVKFLQALRNFIKAKHNSIMRLHKNV